MDRLLALARTLSLRKTVEYAKLHSPYYRRVLRDVNARTMTLESLSAVPILTKAELTARLSEIWSGTGLPQFFLFSSGTAGPATLIPGAEGDLRNGTAAALEQGEPLESLTLRYLGGAQGTAPVAHARSGGIAIPFTKRSNFEWAWRFLNGEHAMPGVDKPIRLLGLPTPAARQLVHFLLERGFDGTRTSVESVTTFSCYLSTGWRRRIETVLGAKVSDCFGFTEAVGIWGVECPACGAYHYSTEAIWEVVDPLAGTAVTSEPGKLLVTTLYPRKQGMILLRYSPGDLVAPQPYCEQARDAGFKPLGRESMAFATELDGRRTYVLLPVHVQELIDTDPTVARIANLRHAGVTATQDDAFPKWRVVSSGSLPLSLDLQIEMKYSPALFPEHWNAFAERVRRGLIELNPNLGTALASGDVRFSISGLPPGSLADDQVFIT